MPELALSALAAFTAEFEGVDPLMAFAQDNGFETAEVLRWVCADRGRAEVFARARVRRVGEMGRGMTCQGDDADSAQARTVAQDYSERRIAESLMQRGRADKHTGQEGQP